MWFQKPPLGTPLDWGNPLNDETVLHLAMNEGHGDKVQDLSLNGNHGTLNGFSFPPTVTSGWNPGKTGIELKFDGVDDGIDCGNNPSCQLNGETSFSAVVHSHNSNHKPLVLWQSGDVLPSIYLRLAGVDPIIYMGGSNYRFFEGGSLTSDEKWHKILAVITGTGQNDIDDSKFYIDGVELAVKSTVKTGGVAPPDTTIIGKTRDHEFTGYIDQPRIMHRIWSAKEARDYTINPWQVYLDE